MDNKSSLKDDFSKLIKYVLGGIIIALVITFMAGTMGITGLALGIGGFIVMVVVYGKIEGLF